MAEQQRGRNHRAAAPRMPKFLASSLPDSVKVCVAEAVEYLRVLWAAEPDAVMPPDLLLKLKTLLGCETIEIIDLLRILMMMPPHMQAHTRENLGALLRGKQRALGRPVTDADFPPDHLMHLFASAYWGGVVAWSADATSRRQQPKHHWTSRANQLEAIKGYATSRPGVPITRPNLHEAGLHRLATILTSAELQALVTEAGLDRQLRRRPDQAARWTRDAVVDAYVALCRTWNVTLSSSALITIGGQASSLREHARRAFGSFRAMVDAAVRAHTDLQPPNRFIAKDGTALDSQSEVIVWNALRAALPDSAMMAHVILPGETQRSADIVLGGAVYVEVLMVPLADMANPANAKIAAYAGKWARKNQVYSQLGVTLVRFEPGDVFDPNRTASRVAEIAAALSTIPITALPPTGKVTRAKGSWTFDMLCAAVAEVAAAERPGVLPTYAQMIAHGYGHAANMLKRHGVRSHVVKRLSLSDPHAKGVWTRERVLEEMIIWCRVHVRYPRTGDVLPPGLASARRRLWSGQQTALHAAVTTSLGIYLPLHKMPNGCHATLDAVARLLEPLARQLGRMPTCAEYRRAGLNSAWSAASRRWGIAAVARALGLKHTHPRRRRK